MGGRRLSGPVIGVVLVAWATMFAPPRALGQLTPEVGENRFEPDQPRPVDRDRCRPRRNWYPPVAAAGVAAGSAAAISAVETRSYEYRNVRSTTTTTIRPRGANYYLDGEQLPHPSSENSDQETLTNAPVSDEPASREISEAEPPWMAAELARSRERQMLESPEQYGANYFQCDVGYGWRSGERDANGAGVFGDGKGVRAGNVGAFRLQVGWGGWLTPTTRLGGFYQFHGGPFAWTADFRPQGFNLARYEGNWTSHQFLPLLHYHPLNAYPLMPFSPYVGCGAGLVLNALSAVEERGLVPVDSVYANHKGRVKASPTAVVLLGTEWRFDDRNWFNVEFSTSYLGTIASGGQRRFASGAWQNIEPFVFRDQWATTLSIGFVRTQ